MKRFLAAIFLALLALSACTALKASDSPAPAQAASVQPETELSAAEEPSSQASAAAQAEALSPTAARMENLTAADIHGTDWDIDAEALAIALREASAHETARKEDALNHYMLSVYLTDVYSSAAENFFLTAGLDEPLVSVLYCDPAGSGHRAVFKSETLYWLLRNLYRTEPDIDEAALAKYRDVLEKPAQKIVADSLAYATTTGFPGYTGFDIYRLVQTDTFTDGAEAYTVYSWDAAFLTDEPDKVLFAGGMRLVAEGRVVHVIENTVFAVKNPDTDHEDFRFLHWGIYQGETEQARVQNARAEILAAFQTDTQQ